MALILSRKPGEHIRIGTDIVLTVVRVDSNTVRLGITAPKDMNIVRQELIPASEESNGDSNSRSN